VSRSGGCRSCRIIKTYLISCLIQRRNRCWQVGDEEVEYQVHHRVELEQRGQEGGQTGITDPVCRGESLKALASTYIDRLNVCRLFSVHSGIFRKRSNSSKRKCIPVWQIHRVAIQHSRSARRSQDPRILLGETSSLGTAYWRTQLPRLLLSRCWCFARREEPSFAG
jgi:hypothetical protein